MLSYVFEFINVDQLEILGVSKQFTYYSLLFISSLVISLFIYFILLFFLKKRYFSVLFYLVSSSCFLLSPYILSFENEWNIVTMMELISIYGYCFIFYLLLRTFRSVKHTSELLSRFYIVCRLLLDKKKKYV